MLRKNVILMGDIVEDSEMVNDADHDNVIRIGYLNDMKRNGDLLENYKSEFDIVVTNDGPFLPTNLIIGALTKSPEAVGSDLDGLEDNDKAQL